MRFGTVEGLPRAADASTAVQQATLAGVFGSIPRRTWLADTDIGRPELRAHEVVAPHPSLWLVLGRALRWWIFWSIYTVSRIGDQLRGKRSIQQKGVRLREMLERVGGTAIKLGQQMSVRVDFVPYEICRELSRLLDEVPPFPFEEARGRIEAAAGRPVSEVFDELEPEPIGSASIACVWRGTLKDGRKVAIKVRRPGVADQFAADITLIAVLTKTMEAMTLMRPGFFHNLRKELRTMFFAELDFVLEGNYQSMFRRIVRRNKMRFVTAPRVYAELSSHDVLTSEFIDGYSCLELLKHVDQNDEQALAELAERGIDPRKIGRRILELSFWSRFGAFFFHADPHPGNILLLPGNKLVMLDFGSCGINNKRAVQGEFEIMRCMLDKDIAAMASAGIAINSPLPDLDLDRFAIKVRQIFWNRYIDLNAKGAEWWERTNAAMWLAFIEGSKEFQLPFNVDTLRMVRSTLLYDTLAFRLNPNVSYLKMFQRWSVDLQRRQARRAWKDRRKHERAERARMISELENLRRSLTRGQYWLHRFLHDLPGQFAASSNKVFYVTSVLLRVGLYVILLVSVAAIAMLVSTFFAGHVPGFEEVTQGVVTHPVIVGALTLVTIVAFKRIRRKLDETDHS